MIEQRDDTEFDTDGEQLTAVDYSGKTFTVTPLQESVIIRAMDGDEKAFESLFMGTYRYVFSTAAKYLHNDQDIYDAIQDTYLKVYKNLSRLESASSFYPWLHRIGENCAKDILALNTHRTVPLEEQPEASDGGIGINADVAADIAAVLQQLPPEQAELLVRVYYDKLRVAEIARMQGVPVTTVHNRLNAAKKKLKELLKIRGIDKPLYGGDLIALLSAAIRNAIGTELLSMAVAEEILHKVTGNKNAKGATVISHFARKERSRAALRIASLLLGGSFVLATAVLATVLLLFNVFDTENAPSESPTTTVTTVTTVTTTTASAATSTTAGTSGSTSNTTASTTGTATEPTTTTTTKKPIEIAGSFEDDEVFGSHTENGYTPLATTDGTVYAVVQNDLVAVKVGETAATVRITDFGDRYTESGRFLNVYGGRVFWINQNSDGKFVLNRCDLDGGNHHTVVFTAFDCSYLTDLTVAEDGVYFTAGIHDDHDYYKSGTLYRTDFDFVVENRLENVASYALNGPALYILYGNGNTGIPFRADRSTFDSLTEVLVPGDLLSFSSIYALGDVLIVGGGNPYVHAEAFPVDDFEVIEIESGRVVRRFYTEHGDSLKIQSVSDDNDGTLIYNFNGQAYLYSIRADQTVPIDSAEGTVYNGWRYILQTDGLYLCELDGSNPQNIR